VLSEVQGVPAFASAIALLEVAAAVVAHTALDEQDFEHVHSLTVSSLSALLDDARARRDILLQAHGSCSVADIIDD
jgi:hypothetical protein